MPAGSVFFPGHLLLELTVPQASALTHSPRRLPRGPLVVKVHVGRENIRTKRLVVEPAIRAPLGHHCDGLAKGVLA